MTSGLLKMGGRFYLVHRPDRFLEIMDVLRAERLAPKRVQFVYPKAGREANMVLIEAIKDGKDGGLRFCEPLTVYDQEGNYQPLIKEILYGKG